MASSPAAGSSIKPPSKSKPKKTLAAASESSKIDQNKVKHVVEMTDATSMLDETPQQNEQEDDVVDAGLIPPLENLTLSTQQPLSGTSSSETQSFPAESDESSEEEAIRIEAEGLGYSEALTKAFVANCNVTVEQQDENIPNELLNPITSCIFINSSSTFNVNCYGYCLVDSTSYKSRGTNDFRAFLKSVRYVGKGTAARCCDHPFEMTNSVNKILESEKIWKKGGKLTAVCLSFFTAKCAKQIEALMMAAFGENHFVEDNKSFSQLWNNRKEKYVPNEKNTPPQTERKYARWGVRLLDEAWKVFTDKPVVLEIVLRHPYAAATRAEDRISKLKIAARECLTAAIVQHKAASKECEASAKQYESYKLEKEKQNDAIEKLKIEIITSPQTSESREKLQKKLKTAKSKEDAAGQGVAMAPQHLETTKKLKKKAEAELEAADEVMKRVDQCFKN